MKHRERFRLGASSLLIYFLVSLGFISGLWAQEPFYKGKTIRIIVGFTPGGINDRWARFYAKYLPKYIAGSPEFVVQNMPGAGTKIAAGYVYSVAKGDGLTLGIFLSGIYLDQVVGRKEVQYDVRKFGWIGSPAPESIILYMRADAPYRSVRDIVKAQQPPRCGDTGTTSSGYILAKVLELALGAKINLVLGYPGGPEIQKLAIKGNPNAIKFPRPILNKPGYQFSFSGLKTACFYKLQKLPKPWNKQFYCDFAVSFEKAAIEALMIKLKRAIRAYRPKQIILGGGVINNLRLRKEARKAARQFNLEIFIASSTHFS